MLDFCHSNIGGRSGLSHGEGAFFGRADCVCVAASERGNGGDGDRSEVRDQRTDVLPLEDLDRRTRRGRSSVGHPDAETPQPGKLVSPARKRAAVNALQNKFTVSERRACQVTDQSPCIQ